MNARFTSMAVLLPILALAVGIARSEHHLSNEQTWRLAVEGYDPRDMLRGRYLRYRLKRDPADPPGNCSDDDRDCCLCLTSAGEGKAAHTRRLTCDAARAQCDAVLPTRYLRSMRRYYVPEDRARELERRFIDAAVDGQAHILVAIDDSGEPHVRRLELRGEVID